MSHVSVPARLTSAMYARGLTHNAAKYDMTVLYYTTGPEGLYTDVVVPARVAGCSFYAVSGCRVKLDLAINLVYCA
jgi:hypothetical protein